MATLTGFTRPVQGDASGNPIVAIDMLAHIVSVTSLTITNVQINPTTIDVTGTIVSGDTANIQSAINSYVYVTTATTYIPLVALTDTVPMIDNSNMVVTAHAAYTADTAILAVANSKTAIRVWESGSFQNGNPVTGDIIQFTDSTTTSGGSATFYPTNDHTSTGTALCSYLSVLSFQPNYRDGNNVYSPGAVTVAGNKKSIGQAFTKLAFSGVTILGINALGTQAPVTIPDGVTVTAGWWGISV